MKYSINVRFVGIIMFVALLALFANAAYAQDLSNKWRIKVNHDADSDGTMMFRVTPKDQDPIDVTVNVKDGTKENRVAVAIREAFQDQLPKGDFHIERDDFEDVLVKKRMGADRFGLEMVSSDVKGVKIRMHKE
jgi:hypothetical protein